MPVYTQNTKGPQSQLSLHTICGILWQFQAVYYIRDATCFSNVAISTLKYSQLHPIFSPIAPQCQIPIWYVFFLLLLSLSKRFAQKCIFLFAKTYPQLVITPWSWAMSAIWSFFSKGTGQESSKGMCTLHNMHKATFGTWRDNLCSSESSEEKYTFCVCLKKHSITNRNIICLKKSLYYEYYFV